MTTLHKHISFTSTCLIRLVVYSLSCVWLFATPWTVVYQAPRSMDSPGKNTGMDCHFLLWGIFLTQGLTWISCIVSRFFYHWVTREALLIFGVSIFSLDDKNAVSCPFQGLVTEINYLPFLQMSLKIKLFFKLNSVITHPRNTPLKHPDSQWPFIKQSNLKYTQIFPFQSLYTVISKMKFFDLQIWPAKIGENAHLKSYLNLTSIMVI